MSVTMTVLDDPDIAYQGAYAAHWVDVFRFSLAWTNDWGAAEDLAQEAYLRLWRSRGRVDWTDPVLPWLLVTARRLATDRFRTLRRRVVVHADGPLRDRPGDDEAIRVVWMDVRNAMRVLSPLERTALVLTALEGATSIEASAALGTSPGAIRAAVSRARQKLEELR
jgi:RNA polymerase sigma-70 factor, ECF subfamily